MKKKFNFKYYSLILAATVTYVATSPVDSLATDSASLITGGEWVICPDSAKETMKCVDGVTYKKISDPKLKKQLAFELMRIINTTKGKRRDNIIRGNMSLLSDSLELIRSEQNKQIVEISTIFAMKIRESKLDRDFFDHPIKYLENKKAFRFNTGELMPGVVLNEEKLRESLLSIRKVYEKNINAGEEYELKGFIDSLIQDRAGIKNGETFSCVNDQTSTFHSGDPAFKISEKSKSGLADQSRDTCGTKSWKLGGLTPKKAKGKGFSLYDGVLEQLESKNSKGDLLSAKLIKPSKL